MPGGNSCFLPFTRYKFEGIKVYRKQAEALNRISMKHPSTERKCRWGILGAANIAKRNWLSILRSQNGDVVAVASRDVDRAAQWIQECQTQHPFPVQPDAVGSYQQLLDRADIDAVYIPLPTGLRKEWVLKAARAGKHVLCEKPCANSVSDLAEMIEACEKAGVQFMDGVMFMHGERLPAIRALLEDGKTVGELRSISSQFSFCADDRFLGGGDIRSKAELEPFGCLGDLGWYNIRFSLWAMHWAKPLYVRGVMVRQTHEGVPLDFSGSIGFEGGCVASFYCSFVAHNQQWAVLSGTKGALRLDDFVLPFDGPQSRLTLSNTHFSIQGCEFRMQSNDTVLSFAEHGSAHESAPDAKLFRRFGEIVLSGARDSHWPEISLLTQRVLDSLLKSARQGGAMQPV